MSLRCAAFPAGIENDWDVLLGDNGVRPATIQCPTLIIHDRADPLVPFAHSEWSHQCISESRLLDIHTGGHLIWFGKDFDFIHNQRIELLRRCLA